MGQPSSKSISIPSDVHAAVKAISSILADVKQAGYAEHAQFAIRLALDEAMSNAIHHGNKNDKKKQVVITYSIDDVKFEVDVTDEGPGFDPEAVPDPTSEENIGRPNGRGLMLMRAYMTEVDYVGSGNRVRMVKKRDCPLPKMD